MYDINAHRGSTQQLQLEEKEQIYLRRRQLKGTLGGERQSQSFIEVKMYHGTTSINTYHSGSA